MRRPLILIPAVCVALLAAPAAAPAKPSGVGVDKQTASTCAQERKAIGRKAFTKKYGAGSRAMRTCIRRTRGNVRAATQEAELDCQQELAEYGEQVFADLYGTDATGSDAMANCIAEEVEWILDAGDGGEEEEEVEG